MARFYPSGGTGGADVSVVTAMKENVEKGKVIVGPDGEPITGELELTGTAADSQVLAGQTYYNTDLHQKRTGTMANQGAWKSEGLAAGAEVAIPPGYHNGGGKVTAKDLASQTPGDATAAQIWTGRKAWVNGQQVTGTLATQGGSTTIPGTAAKTIVTPNKIVTGNIAVAGDPNLIPANIKKDAVIFGVRGIHSGYVPSATDLYLRGNNPSNITGYDNGYVYARLESGQISVGSSSSSLGARTVAISSNKPCDFSGYSKLNLEIVGYNNTQPNITLYALATPHQGTTGPGQYLANTQYMDLPDTTTVISLDIANINQVGYVGIAIGMFVRVAIVCAVFRVWLS